MHHNDSPELKPGDFILNRYIPNATPEERELARERLLRFGLLLVQWGERVAEEGAPDVPAPVMKQRPVIAQRIVRGEVRFYCGHVTDADRTLSVSHGRRLPSPDRNSDSEALQARREPSASHQFYGVA